MTNTFEGSSARDGGICWSPKWNVRGLATADSPVALRFAWPGRQCIHE